MSEPEPVSPGLTKLSTKSLSFHDTVDRIVVKGAEGSNARVARLRATTSTHFKTMLNPQNRSMLKKIEKQRADQKLQAKQLADLQRKLEQEARVIDATIWPHDLTERGPLSSSGAQGEVFKAVWKRMIPVAIKENKTGQWAGDLTAEMQLFLDLHHPHVVACYGILKERGADGQIVNSIVTEKCSTSLKDFLKDNDNWTCFRGSVDQINLQKSTILLHVSQGLSKLHDMNVLHRDIKCGNVLLDGASGECGECHHSGNWKICDFGEAKVLRPPFVRFASPIKWRAGYAHSLVESKRFLPVTSKYLQSKGARFYCYIKPGEKLPSALSSEEWAPCPHGGFAYLFGNLEMTEEKVLSNFDERSCVFPQTMDDGDQQRLDLEFPQHLKQFGILPIKYKPTLNLEELTYEMPTSIVGWLKAQGLGDAQRVEQWDTIEQELGHRCGLQNTLMDLSQLDSSVVKQIAEKMELHASRAARMIRAHESLHELTDAEMLQLAGIGELVGDSIKGQISEYCDLANLTDSDRRKANIPAEATHFVWAYQAEGVDSDDLSDEQKKLINQYSGEFAFASLGSFIYFKAGDVDEPPIVLGVNALGVGDDHRSGTIDRDPEDNALTATIASPEMWDGVGIGLETDVYAFGIMMWEVWTRCFAWHWLSEQHQICYRVGILKQRPRMPPFVGTHQSTVASMIRACLHHDPKKRPTAAQLVEAQLEMVNSIRRLHSDSAGPVPERALHDLAHQSSRPSSAGSDEYAERFWTSAGQFTMHPNQFDRDSGRFTLTVIDPDKNEWIENALVGNEHDPSEFLAAREKMEAQKLGIVFKTTNKATGEKVDYWPKVARVDEGLLAAVFPEIRANVKLEAINGQPVPGTFKEAMPLLKKRPFTLEFSTLADAVESVLAPSKKFGVHAPVVAAAMKGGIQAAYLVKRFEEDKSHHQAQSKLREAELIIAQKDAEIEKLNAQVLALQRSIQQAHDSLGSVPDAQPQAPGSSEA